jgi:hypothetical protein
MVLITDFICILLSKSSTDIIGVYYNCAKAIEDCNLLNSDTNSTEKYYLKVFVCVRGGKTSEVDWFTVGKHHGEDYRYRKLFLNDVPTEIEKVPDNGLKGEDRDNYCSGFKIGYQILYECE